MGKLLWVAGIVCLSLLFVTLGIDKTRTQGAGVLKKENSRIENHQKLGHWVETCSSRYFPGGAVMEIVATWVPK